jgi:uncharacterized RDD family membrane protein YckC
MEAGKQLFQRPVEYASFNRRLYSMSIDILIFILISTPIMNLIGYLLIGENDIVKITQELQPQQFSNEIPFDVFWAKLMEYNIIYKYLFMMFMMFVLLFLYEIFFWVKYDCTPGKWFMSTKLADADTLQSPSVKQYVKRFLFYPISTLPIYLGFFAICWSPRRQSWHDRLSNVVVIVNHGNFKFFESIRDRIKTFFSGKKA